MFERPLDSEQAFGHHGAMRRTYVRRRRTVAIVSVSIVAVLMSPLAAGAVRLGHAPQAPATRTIVVMPGETLWGIAHRVAPAADPRETVALIEEINAVDAGSLRAGQALLVPAA